MIYPKGKILKQLKDPKLIDAMKFEKVRIVKERDECYAIADLEGDCFCPTANCDIEEATLKKQQKAFRARVVRAGVWGAVAEYWTGREWAEGGLPDSRIFGFVGNDFIGSGYEDQLIEEALAKYNDQSTDIRGYVIDPVLLAEL